MPWTVTVRFTWLGAGTLPPGPATYATISPSAFGSTSTWCVPATITVPPRRPGGAPITGIVVGGLAVTVATTATGGGASSPTPQTRREPRERNERTSMRGRMGEVSCH